MSFFNELTIPKLLPTEYNIMDSLLIDDLVIREQQIHTYLREQIENSCSFYKLEITSDFIAYYVSLVIPVKDAKLEQPNYGTFIRSITSLYS